MVLNAFSIAVGLLVIVAVLGDVFQSVVVPRAVAPALRLSSYIWRAAWMLWPELVWRLNVNDADRREDLLATFAPFMLIALLAIWAALLILGFALVLWGVRADLSPPAQSFGDALYFSGTSLLTIGFGDVVGRTAAPRLASVLAALSGLSFLSIMTAYLFALFGSFQNRETFVVMVGARAGAPPSGVNLLAIAGYSQTRDDLGLLMLDAQRWAAQLMESHLAYPTLAYFRSSHDDESWIGTLGTLLDTATLMMTTVDGVKDGQARIFYNVGRHATRDLVHYFNTGDIIEAAGIERSEFEHAYDRLAAAGYALRERDESWDRFAKLRASYAAHLNSLARHFQIPPLQWIGDRSLIKAPPHH